MADTTFHVFYAGMLYGEVSGSMRGIDLPDGAYVRSHRNHWYIKQFGSLTPINHCDIPKQLLALCLLIDLT